MTSPGILSLDVHYYSKYEYHNEFKSMFNIRKVSFCFNYIEYKNLRTGVVVTKLYMLKKQRFITLLNVCSVQQLKMITYTGSGDT